MATETGKSAGDMYISDLRENPEQIERIRNEILSNVETRRLESDSALRASVSFCGILYSGATISILGFLSGFEELDKIPILMVYALGCFSFSLILFALALHFHSQLHAKRYTHISMMAQRFFTRNATLGQFHSEMNRGQAPILYKLMFWGPFTFAVAGYILVGVVLL